MGQSKQEEKKQEQIVNPMQVDPIVRSAFAYCMHLLQNVPCMDTSILQLFASVSSVSSCPSLFLPPPPIIPIPSGRCYVYIYLCVDMFSVDSRFYPSHTSTAELDVTTQPPLSTKRRDRNVVRWKTACVAITSFGVNWQPMPALLSKTIHLVSAGLPSIHPSIQSACLPAYLLNIRSCHHPSGLYAR